MLKNYRSRAFLIALALALVVTGGLFYYLKVKSIENENKVRVITAVSNIEANTVIKNSQIKEISVPQSSAVPGAIVDKEKVVGKVVKEPIYKGEQILQMNLMKGEKEEGLSAVLPEGFRAVTIKTDMVTGVGGHIKDGDYVDVLVFVNPPYSTEKVKTVFQNVKVLDADYKEKQSSENRFITLCMNPNDAEKLFLVEEISKIKLSLRNRIDKKAKSLTGSSLELVK